MRTICRLWVPVLLLFASPVLSQELRGRVLSERGEGAVGVTVQFKDKANSIATNADGTFRIMATRLPDTLVFSSAGYESYKVVITEKNIKDPNFEVVLLNTRKVMNEVVVLGAGRQPRRVSAETPDARKMSTHEDAKIYKPLADGSKDARPLFFADTNILTNREGILAKSKILTAGEINDFNKWKMWEDFAETEFKQYSNTWGIQLKERYTVQLTDKNRNAVTNEPVFLIHKITKDTIWKAYTDNTGKAELWSGFRNESTNRADHFITDSRGNIISNPSMFENGVNLMTIDKSCQVTPDVDIAFVVDATGSMSDEIEFLKLELEDVIRHTMDKYRSLSLRAASVFYRDKKDDYLTKKVSFHEDLLKTLNFIKLQHAAGGGDFPEAVDDAMSVALDSLAWNSNARAKLLFLVLDAPPHKADSEKMQALIKKAAAMGVRIIPLACSGTDKSTEFLLRSMALATNGTYTFLTDHSGVGDKHIEPTTDKYEMELLNSLLQRIIGQYLYAKECSGDEQAVQQVKQPDNILSVKLYPNPTSGQFTIESKKELKEIFITDFTGKILMRLPAADKKGRWQVNIGHYPSATYLVKYITKENRWGAEKVVLVR
jgi:hypothetical protein